MCVCVFLLSSGGWFCRRWPLCHVWIISTGIPGDERGVQGACRALQSFGARSMCVSPIASFNAFCFSLFFPSCAGWCFSIISLAFGTAFVSNTFNNSVPREDSRSKHPSRFVAQFHRSHSIHFKMEVCTVFTSARHALHCPTHQRKVDLLTII